MRTPRNHHRREIAPIEAAEAQALCETAEPLALVGQVYRYDYRLWIFADAEGRAYCAKHQGARRFGWRPDLSAATFLEFNGLKPLDPA